MISKAILIWATGKPIAKISLVLALGISASPIVLLFEKYVFSDWQFITYLAILITLDTTLGVFLAWRKKNISSEAFSKIFLKVIVYCSFLIVTHIVTHFQEDNKSNIWLWFDSLAYSAIVARESLSILEKCSLILPGAFPSWLIARLQYFDQNGKLPTDENSKN